MTIFVAVKVVRNDGFTIRKEKYNYRVAVVIAQWTCLHLPSCGAGFESRAQHLNFYYFLNWNLWYICYRIVKRTKRSQNWPIKFYFIFSKNKKKKYNLFQLVMRAPDKRLMAIFIFLGSWFSNISPAVRPFSMSVTVLNVHLELCSNGRPILLHMKITLGRWWNYCHRKYATVKASLVLYSILLTCFDHNWLAVSLVFDTLVDFSITTRM